MKPKSKKSAGNDLDKVNKPDGELAVKITSFGITAERANSLAQTVGRHRAVQKFLRGTRYRLLTLELLDVPEGEKKAARARPQSAAHETPPLWEAPRSAPPCLAHTRSPTSGYHGC